MSSPRYLRLLRSILPWVLLVAAVLALALLLYSDSFKIVFAEATSWAKERIESNPVTGAVVFFIFSLISAMLAFASSAVLVPAGNLVWGSAVTFLLLWSGWIAGGILAYGIGRLARPLLVRLGYREKLVKYQEYVSRRMRFWILLLFCFAVPSEIPGYVLGGMHYSFFRFVLAISIVEAIYALGLVFAGDSLLAADSVTLMVIAGLLILVALGARLLFRKFRKRS